VAQDLKSPVHSLGQAEALREELDKATSRSSLHPSCVVWHSAADRNGVTKICASSPLPALHATADSRNVYCLPQELFVLSA
jgi:hypothetical protein